MVHRSTVPYCFAFFLFATAVDRSIQAFQGQLVIFPARPCPTARRNPIGRRVRPCAAANPNKESETAPVASVASGAAAVAVAAAVESTAVASATVAEADNTDLTRLAQDLADKLEPCLKDIAKTCKVRVAPVKENRLGLVATQSIAKGDVVLAMPYDERFELCAGQGYFRDILPDSYDSWTGDEGWIALSILNEVARATPTRNAAAATPNRQSPPITTPIQDFLASWALSLPGPLEFNHPLLWSEKDQEVLQASTTNKIYKQMDDVEEDASWLVQNIFEKQRAKFPETVPWNGQMIPCYSVQGFTWALALAKSRSFFLNGSLRLLPLLDMCNHGDDGEEIRDGFMGTFGTIKGAVLIASKSYQVGDEVICSYGPKSAADNLLDHGFCPEQCWKTAVAEITVEVDPDDRFHDDKLDILEYETYDQKPMNPVQSFDVVCAPGRDGEPDKAMIQFMRLCKIGSTDAFLLESIFRQDVWSFMELPVSEKNELDVVNSISDVCQRALAELTVCEGGPAICTRLRESESKALSRTVEYLQREKAALDLKEYYQERRLKDLGLDSTWSPEDEADSDLTFGQRRAPGGADYDW